MNQLWVIFVAGHAVSVGGNEFFHNHDKCIAKAAELGGACEVMAAEPQKNSPKHGDWEKVYCIPGVYYIPNSDRTVSCPAPKDSDVPTQPER